MRLSTKVRYGARAMLDLAMNADQGMINVGDIAERQEVSVKYLEQLLTALRAAGLVRSARGASGGHALARPAGEITLRDVYIALEGADGFVECNASPVVCARAGRCVTQEVWAKMYAASMEVLASVTLSDLAQRARECPGDGAAMYFI